MSSRWMLRFCFGRPSKGSTVPPKPDGKRNSFRLGARLNPAHCHSFLRRVERYRDRHTRSPGVRLLFTSLAKSGCMNVFELTRALIDIESITLNEEASATSCTTTLRLWPPDSTDHRARGSRAAGASTSSRNGASRWRLRCPPISTPCLRSFAAREDETHILGTRRLRHQGIVAAMIHAVEGLLASASAASDYCSWWVRNATARALTVRRSVRAGRATS